MTYNFNTPRVVSTIAQGRIDQNGALTALLQNFADPLQPLATEVALEGVQGLRTGMLWYKSGTTTSEGQGRLFVYNGSIFTRNGIAVYQMPSATAANTAASGGKISRGELVDVGDNRLYMVNSAGTNIVDIGIPPPGTISTNADTLDNIDSLGFLRRNAADTLVATITGSHMLNLSNTTATSASIAPLWLSGTAGSLLIDSAGQKRISWNDGTLGDFTIRGGHYFSSGEKYVVTNDGAAKISLNTDAKSGVLEFAVAGTGTGGSAVTWSNILKLDSTGLTLNGSAVLTALAGGSAYVTTGSLSDVTTGGTRFQDNIPVILGTGNDAELFHNGQDNYVRLTSGNLHVNNGTTNVFSVIRSTGNIGINTTVPDNLVNYKGLTISDTSGAFVFMKSTTGGITTEISADNGVSKGKVGTRTAHSLSLITNSLERVSIDTSGNMSVTGDISTTSAWDAATGGGQLYLNGATGNRIDWNLNGVAAPAFTTRSAGTKLVLYPAIGASSADYAIGMESGGMWFGTSVSAGNQFRWYGGTAVAATLTGAGAFTAVGDITAFSDARLKSNVETISGALDKVSNLRGVYFDRDGVRKTGVIAQEIEEILPEVVNNDGEYKSVAYGNIVGVLIEAIKEIRLELDSLKAGK
jgi:hypothetical protein